MNENNNVTASPFGKKSQANKAHYESLAARRGELLSPEDLIEYNEMHWSALTAEPRDVDFLEVDADGVRAMWISPKQSAQDRVIFYAHGGGFICGSIYTHRKMVAHLAKAAGCRALIFDFPFAHEKKYPNQIETAFTAYRWLSKQGIRPENIAVAGDSAGTILIFAILQKLRESKLPQPAAALAMSGWFDLALTGKSYETNRSKDIAFAKEGVDWLAHNFLGENTNRQDPLASPLYADLKGFPPIFIQVGADETLLDDSRMFAEKAKSAGIETRLDIFPNMLHSFQMMAGRAPEADEAIRRLADWLRPKLGL